MGNAESGNQPPQLRLRGGATSALDPERGRIPSPEVPAAASQPGRGHETDEESSPEVDIIGSTEVESGGSKGKDDEDTGASQPLEEMPNGSGRDHDAVHPSISLRGGDTASETDAETGDGPSGAAPSSELQAAKQSRGHSWEAAAVQQMSEGGNVAEERQDESSDSQDSGGPSPFMRVTGAYSPRAAAAELAAELAVMSTAPCQEPAPPSRAEGPDQSPFTTADAQSREAERLQSATADDPGESQPPAAEGTAEGDAGAEGGMQSGGEMEEEGGMGDWGIPSDVVRGEPYVSEGDDEIADDDGQSYGVPQWPSEGEESDGSEGGLSEQADDPADADYEAGVDRPGPSQEMVRGDDASDLQPQQQLALYKWPSRSDMGKPPRGRPTKNRQNGGAVGGLSAHERMRDLLRDVLDALNKRVPRQKRFIFTERVNQVIVPDYGNHVEAKDEVWLSLIRKRVREGAHKSLASLLKDFEQLAANARAYNTPGHGRLGSPFLIDDAEEILRVVKEEGDLRAAQFAELDPLVAEEAVRGVNLEAPRPVQHRAGAVVLPAGFSVREIVSAAKPRGYIEYVAQCPVHGSGKRLDRWKEVADFFRTHHSCREDWLDWGQQSGESEEEYYLRVRDTFHFRRSEMPKGSVARVHVTGQSRSQRPGQSTGSGSSRSSVPMQRPPRTWNADADHPARTATLAKIRDSVARMKEAFPGRSYAPEAELEHSLYCAAGSEADYSRAEDFDERLQRAIGLARRRSHTQGGAASTPLSPTSAHRSMATNCDMLLSAANLVDESEQADPSPPGERPAAFSHEPQTQQGPAEGFSVQATSGGPPAQNGGWQGSGIAIGIPVAGSVPGGPPATAARQVPPAGAPDAQGSLAVATAGFPGPAAAAGPVRPPSAGPYGMEHLQGLLLPLRRSQVPPANGTPTLSPPGGGPHFPGVITSIPVAGGIPAPGAFSPPPTSSSAQKPLSLAQAAVSRHPATPSVPIVNGGMGSQAAQQQKEPAAPQARASGESSQRPRINYFLSSNTGQPAQQPPALQQSAAPRPALHSGVEGVDKAQGQSGEESQAAASSTPPSTVSVVRATQNAAFAQLQLTRPSLMRPLSAQPVQAAAGDLPSRASFSGTAPQPPARQGSAATVTTGARLGSVGTAVRQESVTAVPAAQPSAASYPWSLPPQGSLNKAQASGQLPARIGPGFSTSRAPNDMARASTQPLQQPQASAPTPVGMPPQGLHQVMGNEPLGGHGQDKLQDLWACVHPLLLPQELMRFKAHFDAYQGLAAEERRNWGLDLHAMIGSERSRKIVELYDSQQRSASGGLQGSAAQHSLGMLTGQPTSNTPAPLTVNTARAPNQAASLVGSPLAAARAGLQQSPRAVPYFPTRSPRQEARATPAIGPSPLGNPLHIPPAAMLLGNPVSSQHPLQQYTQGAQIAAAKVKASMSCLSEALDAMQSIEADNARLQAATAQLAAALQETEARRMHAESVMVRQAAELQAAAREHAAVLEMARKERAALSFQLAQARNANASLEARLCKQAAAGAVAAGSPSAQPAEHAVRSPSSSPTAAVAAATAKLPPAPAAMSALAAVSAPSGSLPIQAAAALNDEDVSRAIAAALKGCQRQLGSQDGARVALMSAVPGLKTEEPAASGDAEPPGQKRKASQERDLSSPKRIRGAGRGDITGGMGGLEGRYSEDGSQRKVAAPAAEVIDLSDSPEGPGVSRGNEGAAQ